MWNDFKRKSGCCEEEYDAWQFGGAPDKLADLVMCGKKVGTASAYCLYELDQEELPKEGEYSVILNSKDEAVCIIRTSKIYVVPFNEVSADHAFKEGEGDQSLSYWREVHEAFFRDCLAEYSLTFTEEMLVVCEEFERVY